MAPMQHASLLRSNYSPPRSVKRIKRTYSKRRKIQVLLFLENHRIPLEDGQVYPSQLQDASPVEDGFRRPSLRETMVYFGIKHISTIQYWWTRRHKILGKRVPRYRAKWPALEAKLYEEFCDARKGRRLVQHTWFRRRAKALFAELYPRCDIFVFSNGWFTGFLKRHQITRRRVTHASTMVPEAIVKSVNDFLQFIRRNSRGNVPKRSKSWQSTFLMSDPVEGLSFQRFPLHLIVNLDETPLPFEFLDGYTYEHKGAISVQGKSERSGWTKRQATLILTLLADGSYAEELKPVIVFHGEGKVLAKEGRFYNTGVEVKFNKTAYNNEALFEEWINTRLASYTQGRECLLVIDVARFHKTPKILSTLKANNITVALIPPGLTAYLQPLDVGFNGPFKKWLRDETDLYLDRLDDDVPVKWSVGDRRIMTTHVVAQAWQRAFTPANRSLVAGLFKKTGISVHPDGREDNLISIKGIDSNQLNLDDWYRVPEPETKPEEETPVSDLSEATPNDLEDQEYVLTMEAFNLPPNRYRASTVVELRTLCRQRGIAVSGRKVDIIRRLEAYDVNLERGQPGGGVRR